MSKVFHWVLCAIIGNYQTWGESCENLQFVAKFVRVEGTLGTHYLQSMSEMEDNFVGLSPELEGSALHLGS